MCGPGVAAGDLEARSARCPAQGRARRSTVPGRDQGRVAHQERRADALLVGEPPLRAQPVLAEEVAVVADEDDEGAVERPAPLERAQQHADALVHRGHHRRAEADLLLGARVDRVEQGARPRAPGPSARTPRPAPAWRGPRPRAAGRSAAAGTPGPGRGRGAARRRHVAAERVGVDGAVLALEHVGVHRLVRQVQGEGPLARALDERAGPARSGDR